ncbi:hypothetical protein CSA56_04080 [candidate division KSB3 bacterium]|uniref:Uncharacterized protein n=1 Tax=candidate division KSB3 bacterium TaxID=2044937 RepID=A0A2G6KII3_9BACT|nr:MAG: hypothetical protein CSA56_04080 [candidate division KSB3 bacterium]
MTNMTKRTLMAYLEQRSKEQLCRDIADLFTKFPVVQDYYQAKINPIDEALLVEKYKAVIEKEFFTNRGFGKARRSVARKAVSDYKKVSGDPVGLADLMLFFVETGVRFTNEYGDIDEPFYISMESMYQKALQHIFKYGLHYHFEDRCQRIVYNSAHTGWSFHDILSEIFYEFYQN